MDRHAFLIAAATSPLAVGGEGAASRKFDTRDFTSLRLLISVGANRVGVLSDRSTLLFYIASTAELRRVNMPRAEPGSVGWHWAVPPAEPPFSPGYRNDDVTYDRAPDDVTAQTVYRDGVALALSRRAAGSYLVYFSPSRSQIATYDLSALSGVKALFLVPSGFALVSADNRESTVPVPTFQP